MPYIPHSDREKIWTIIQRQNPAIADLLGLPPLNLSTLKLVIDNIPMAVGADAYYTARPGPKGRTLSGALLRFDRSQLREVYDNPDYYNRSELLEKLVVHELTHAIIGARSPSGANYNELSSSFQEGVAEWTALTLSQGWWMYGAGAEGKVEDVRVNPEQRTYFRPLRDKYGPMALFLETKAQQHPGLIQELARTLHTRYGDLPQTFQNYTGEPLRESIRRFRNPTPGTRHRVAPGPPDRTPPAPRRADFANQQI